MTEFITFPSGRIICREHHKERCPICFISKDKQSISKDKGLVRSHSDKGKQLNSIYERFHNFGVKFDARVDWNALFKYPVVVLNPHSYYRRLDYVTALVKVFKKSILITLRASQDIKGLPVKQAEALALSKINDIISILPKAIIISNKNVVNTHNAFVNHPTAKYNVNVKVDGESRLISDNSKGMIEFEAVNPVHAVSDSEKLEVLNKDIITNVWDIPSVTKSKLDTILQVQMDYAENIKKHLAVQDKTLETLDKIQSSISSKHSDGRAGECVIPPKVSLQPQSNNNKDYRLWKARELLKQYGW